MFLIRTELHNEKNYDRLHEAMASRGMLRFIKSNDGTVYKLPTGTYFTRVGNTAANVRETAQAATRAVGHYNAMVVVAKTESVSWDGLEEATPIEKLYAVGA